MLFIIVNELLQQAVLQDQTIKGYKTGPNSTICNSVYADDTVFIATSNRSAAAFMQHIDKYCRATAAKINVNKSNVMVVGKWHRTGHVPAPFSAMQSIPPNQGERYLGFKVGFKVDYTDQWNKAVTGTCLTLNQWKKAGLSLVAKAMVANSVALSKFWYLASLIAPPKTVINKAETYVRAFIRGKRSKCIVAFTDLQRPKEMGGIGLHNLASKADGLRATWVPKILDESSDLIWRPLAVKYFQNFVRTSTIHPLLLDPSTRKPPEFLIDHICAAWRTVGARAGEVKKGQWVGIIRGRRFVAPLIIKSLNGNKAILGYHKSHKYKHKQFTERSKALLAVTPEFNVNNGKIARTITPNEKQQRDLVRISTDTPNMIGVSNKQMYHLMLAKKLGHAPKNIWHLDKLKLTPEYVSFYYVWTKGRIDTRRYDQSGNIIKCSLCGHDTPNTEHAILKCEGTNITVLGNTLLKPDEASTKEAIRKALTNKSKSIKHASKLTIITLKERLNCYWTSTLNNTNTKNSYQAKLHYVEEILNEIAVRNAERNNKKQVD
jgi:hypothetical protein